MSTGEESSSSVTDVPRDIPKEICMMVDHLYRNASKQVSSAFS